MLILTIEYDICRKSWLDVETESEEFTTECALRSSSNDSDYDAYLNDLLSDSKIESRSHSLRFNDEGKDCLEEVVGTINLVNEIKNMADLTIGTLADNNAHNGNISTVEEFIN